MNFADTNWLASVYIEPDEDDVEALKRRRLRMRPPPIQVRFNGAD